jgi:hypothetical protein
MTEKKRFLFRLDTDLYAMLEKWAADDLRSVNAQIEYLLTEAGKKAGRFRAHRQERKPPSTGEDDG